MLSIEKIFLTTTRKTRNLTMPRRATVTLAQKQRPRQRKVPKRNAERYLRIVVQHGRTGRTTERITMIHHHLHLLLRRRGLDGRARHPVDMSSSEGSDSRSWEVSICDKRSRTPATHLRWKPTFSFPRRQVM